MRFEMPQKVKFKHCDPAGIVFYPRYFEMINDCVEAFFDDGLAHPFEDLHRSGGVPTADISVQFTAPSRHGDRLILALSCLRLGRTSLEIEVEATCEGQRRFIARSVLVLVDANGRPVPWPSDLRGRLQMRVQKAAA